MTPFYCPFFQSKPTAELLRDFSQKMIPGEREEHLTSISRNTRRMGGMMEEILILSRMDAGKLHYLPAPLDLAVFCRRVVDEVISSTNRRCSIELRSEVMPEAMADERLIGHVLTNVLSNAVKYSEPSAMVNFDITREAEQVVFVVRDQGIGIPNEDQQNLFTAFYRGGNVGTRPGTGLGLLMVKRCVGLHQGSVRLESVLGKGTTVTVKLPVFK